MARSKASKAAQIMGRKGGRNRAKKYDAAQRQAWARMGAVAANEKRRAAKLLQGKGFGESETPTENNP